MNAILEYLKDPLVLAAIGIIAFALALIIMLKVYADRSRRMADEVSRLEIALREQMAATSDKSEKQAAQSREELSGNLRGMSDSVTRVMSEMARTQQVQLDSFTGQIRDIGRGDEARLISMQQTVEQRLGAYETKMDRIADVLDEKLDRDEDRMERLRLTIEERLEDLQKDNGERLLRIEESVGEKLTSTLDQKLGESFRSVTDQLDQVYKGLGEMQNLASGVGDLKRVLTGVRARGLLGEIQLGALLSQLMAREQYEQDVQIREGGERVNFAIKLPGRTSREPQSLLPVDARFPQEAYYHLLSAMDDGNPALIESAGAQLETELVNTCRRLMEQFVDPPRTTEFAVLFMPSEGVYAEVLRRPALSEKLQREYRVMLTGPSTFAALLNSLQMGYKTLSIERQSEEVWALLGAVRGEFVKFADALARTQKRIRQASESIEDATRKSRTIQKRLKDVEVVGAEERKALFTAVDDLPYEPTAVSDDWD